MYEENEITLEMALGLPRVTTVESVGGILCHICRQKYSNKRDYEMHFRSHSNDKIQYTCVVCEKSYSGYPTFRSHCYTQHILKDKFKCSHCAKCFPKKFFLKEHVDTMHNFHCPIKSCNRIFTNKTELHQHQMVHKSAFNKPPYNCRSCGDRILNPDDCEAHIDSHYTLTYSCPICDKEVTKENAEKHLTIHFKDEKDVNTKQNLIQSKDQPDPEDSSIKTIGGIKCWHCQLKFADRMEIDLHFKAEHKGKDVVYACIVCDKQYEKYASFGNHCHSHCARNKFECINCNKSFDRLSILVTHNETCRSLKRDDKPFACLHCNRRYPSEKKMQEHSRAKHDDCEYKCTEPGCDGMFNTPKELLLHRKHHSACNWCRACGMKFTTLASCYQHLDIHKKKFFCCPVCPKTASEKHHIMKHVPKHFATTFFVCKICGKVYSEKRRLIQHTKIHAHVKKYRCKHCGSSFSKSSHMQQHVNIHTGMKPYKCVECPKTFASYPNWSKHLKRMHNIDAKTVKKPDINQEDLIEKHFIEEHLIEKYFIEFDDDSMASDSDSTIGEEIHAIETYLFGDEDNGKPLDENCNTDSGNALKTIDNVVDDNISLELAELAPERESQILDELMDVGVLPEAPPQPKPVQIPPSEYGPELYSVDQPTTPPGELINLDDHLLPHINPLLTVNRVSSTDSLSGENHPMTTDSLKNDVLKLSPVPLSPYPLTMDLRLSPVPLSPYPLTMDLKLSPGLLSPYPLTTDLKLSPRPYSPYPITTDLKLSPGPLSPYPLTSDLKLSPGPLSPYPLNSDLKLSPGPYSSYPITTELLKNDLEIEPHATQTISVGVDPSDSLKNDIVNPITPESLKTDLAKLSPASYSPVQNGPAESVTVSPFYGISTIDMSQPIVWGSNKIVYSCFNNEMSVIHRPSVV